MERRHWYHCTSHYLGESFTAERRAPKLKTSDEPSTPRLCVAPTIAGCFAAVLFTDGEPVYCYRTETPRRAVAPCGVWDRWVTGERWLIPPVTMVLDRVIDAELASRAHAAIRLYHRYTRLRTTLGLRVAQFALASELLGTSRDKRLASKFCRLMGIDDAESYVLAKTDQAIHDSEVRFSDCGIF